MILITLWIINILLIIALIILIYRLIIDWRNGELDLNIFKIEENNDDKEKIKD